MNGYKNGRLGAGQLHEALLSLKVPISKLAVQQMIAEVDLTPNRRGEIEFPEFCILVERGAWHGPDLSGRLPETPTSF